MFTGLIEASAKIKSINKNSNGAVICIECPFSDEVKIGDSISINGACLTAVKINGDEIYFEISNETLSVANYEGFNKGKIVNIERAVKADSRLDGHLVSGHIDGTASVKSITKDGFSYDIEFETTDDVSKYIVKKGSITVNGISLTVKCTDGNTFNTEIIPHTMEMTNLNLLKIGDKVNIETDIIGRYIEKFLSLNKNKSNISMEMLRDNGYL